MWWLRGFTLIGWKRRRCGRSRWRQKYKGGARADPSKYEGEGVGTPFHWLGGSRKATVADCSQLLLGHTCTIFLIYSLHCMFAVPPPFSITSRSGPSNRHTWRLDKVKINQQTAATNGVFGHNNSMNFDHNTMIRSTNDFGLWRYFIIDSTPPTSLSTHPEKLITPMNKYNISSSITMKKTLDKYGLSMKLSFYYVKCIKLGIGSLWNYYSIRYVITRSRCTRRVTIYSTSSKSIIGRGIHCRQPADVKLDDERTRVDTSW